MIRAALTTGLLFLATVSSAQARVLGIRLAEEPNNADGTRYVVTIEACRATYPSVTSDVQVIGPDAATVAFRTLSVDTCPRPLIQSDFLISVDQELKAKGLDPVKAHVFFQLQ